VDWDPPWSLMRVVVRSAFVLLVVVVAVGWWLGGVMDARLIACRW
jgi:hypothetical protein